MSRLLTFTLAILLVVAQSTFPFCALAAPSDTGVRMVDTLRSLNSKEITQIPTAELPSTYSLTNIGECTPVKLQNPWGDCWAFAIAAALESSILKAQKSLDDETTIVGDASSTPQLINLTDSVDLSERAIAWFAHELQTEASAGSQAGEGYALLDPSNKSDQLSEGNFKMISSQLIAGQALVTEEEAPYQYNNYEGNPPWYSIGSRDGATDDARTYDWSLDDSVRTSEEVEWIVSDVFRMESPSVTKTDSSTGTTEYVEYNAEATLNFKRALIDIGAIAVALDCETTIPNEVVRGNFNSTSASDHLSFTTWSQYNASQAIAYNHAATIVGWDDNYNASNFSGTKSGQPPGNGAWLCKNQWGSDKLYSDLGSADEATHWGLRADSESGLATADPTSEGTEASGFFWLSYYDHGIQDPTCFSVSPASESLENVYQYDYMGSAEYTVPSTFTGDVWVGNVFTAEETELLRALSVETFDENEQASVRVYAIKDDGNADTDADGAAELNNMSLLAEAQMTFANAGFHTINLNKPVLLNKNEKFFVTSKVSFLKDVSTNSYLNVEIAYDDPIDDGAHPTLGHVISNAGESFMSVIDGQWFPIDENNETFRQAVIGDREVSVTFGNALVKAYTDSTTMSIRGQIYQTLKLQ